MAPTLSTPGHPLCEVTEFGLRSRPRGGSGPRVYDSQVRCPPRVKGMEREKSGELEGQTSVNDLLDEPIGATPIQMALPILVQMRPGDFRHLS